MRSHLPRPGLTGPAVVPDQLRRRGACTNVEPGLFDIDEASSVPSAAEIVRDICAGCPVNAPCRAYALDNEPFGFWGGLAADERDRLRGVPLVLPEERRESEHVGWLLTHGATASEMAARYEVSLRTVERWKRRAGTPRLRVGLDEEPEAA